MKKINSIWYGGAIIGTRPVIWTNKVFLGISGDKDCNWQGDLGCKNDSEDVDQREKAS